MADNMTDTSAEQAGPNHTTSSGEGYARPASRTAEIETMEGA